MGGRRVKKGTKGDSAMFITRAQALKRLQVSLADFRRLCILKGVYPREPKKKLSGLDKTYYHLKDIIHLKYDPILSKIRELKVFLRKYKKAMGRNDRTKAKAIMDNKPVITLQHIVKERYPCLADALRDIDDALSTCSLFASLGASDEYGISSSLIKKSSQLVDEFMYLVSECNFLRKSFISIKGFYFQAQILGETITWLMPHQFTQKIPDEVDFKVISTFLEFYHTLLKFVNFKLYKLNNMTYPPSIDDNLLNSGARFLSLSSYNLSNMSNTNGKSDLSDYTRKVEDKKLFSGLTFFVSREVPLIPTSFLIKSFGGQVGWEGEYSKIKEKDNITHFVVDRPISFLKKSMSEHPNSEFIQPQWLFDSTNESIRLPVRPYHPSEKLPPHLSPFVDDSSQGYIPTQRQIFDDLKQPNKLENKNLGDFDSNSTVADDSLSNDESDPELQQAREDAYFESIEKERSNHTGNSILERSGDEENDSHHKNKLEETKGIIKKRREEEQMEQRKALLKKKHKRLLQRIEHSKNILSKKAKRLESRRNKLSS
ncbi:pescadillo containing BRCT domain [Cryptosporidium bovis]|uniref:pescadillo containing BRCT domain n=1 Tax=Cryptosporidium bovis TaxID=310047 RepID=UPI00351A07E4|nr:pescadillo containing BRCT domain [Cryptosporidium bovis]